MKAVLYRFLGGATNKYEKVVLSDFAVTFGVSGDYVTVRAGGDVMAVIKLGDHDYVRLEQAPAQAAQPAAEQVA